MKEEAESMVDEVVRDETPGDGFTDGVNALLDRARGLFREAKYQGAVPVTWHRSSMASRLRRK
jgi:hypothetical protein